MNAVVSQIASQISSMNNGLEQMVSSLVSDHDAFKKFQLSQLAHFQQRGFPTRKEEKWKYTDVSSFARQLIANQYVLPNREVHHTILPTTLSDAIHVIFVDGFFCEQLSNLSLVPKGATVCSTRAIHSNEQALKSLIKSFDVQLFPMACLNAIGMTEGLYVHIPRHMTLKHLIHCTYIQTQANSMIAPRHVINVEDNSAVSIIEEYRGDTRSITNAVTLLSVGRNARLDYYKLQKESPQAIHFSSLFISQNENSSVNSYSLSCGGKLAREDIYVSAYEKQASCQLRGLYTLSQDHQQSDHYLHVDHSASHCTSSMIYKGIMNNKSRAVFNGKVVVKVDAKQIHAHQENHNLLLSPNAEINTKPELEIYADDVKCTHGATVGQLDAEALFYCRSRGIDKEQAKEMLQAAFTTDFFDAIPNLAIKAYLQQQVDE